MLGKLYRHIKKWDRFDCWKIDDKVPPELSTINIVCKLIVRFQTSCDRFDGYKAFKFGIEWDCDGIVMDCDGMIAVEDYGDTTQVKCRQNFVQATGINIDDEKWNNNSTSRMTINF